MSPRRATLLAYAAIGLFVLSSVVRIVEARDVPWLTIALVACGTGLLAGPASWLARDRLSGDSRETLSIGAIVVGMVAGPIWLGVALAFGLPVMSAFDGVLLGTVLGLGVVTVVERTVVPERFRG
ncbi:hypothetical protein [Halorubrum sp. DTA98]|uniref:hypothetical protein n=1 Tax=Halorubrum sp. DTA98 TaxID=3402163 RepID=UPI003AAB0B25